ncbi:MAG: ABC transporter ATP-binding protein [Methylophaga sp.]|nr:MAG: ABC transporter ATP-binding protein [Methylophaga sp.]
MARLNAAYLQAHQLSHSFGPNEILREIDFRLDQGKVVSVVGPSGGGKTTLLHLCAGLLDITEGNVENSFKSFAFAFQDPRLLPWQTALDNIAFGLKAKGIAKQQREQLAVAISAEFGLEGDDLTKFPKDLSGGMRQRVSFARALVLQPELLFLDEPFSALDIGLKQELQQILIQQITQKKLSILFITHDLMEAVRLSDQILLLAADPGRIVHTFTIDTPIDKRSEQFVYDETAKLLTQPKIIETFELTMNLTSTLNRDKQT